MTFKEDNKECARTVCGDLGKTWRQKVPFEKYLSFSPEAFIIGRPMSMSLISMGLEQQAQNNHGMLPPDETFSLRLRLAAPLYLQMANSDCPIADYFSSAMESVSAAGKAKIVPENLEMEVIGVSLAVQKTIFSGSVEKVLKGGGADYSFNTPCYRVTTLSGGQSTTQIREKFDRDVSLIYVFFASDLQMRRDSVTGTSGIQRTSDCSIMRLPTEFRYSGITRDFKFC
jgi:hypothetical protein